ncbi:MAG: ABC transporter permease [bacterium]
MKDNTKDLLLELVRTSFKLRYNNSVLGFVWVLLKPFLTFLILYFVWTSFSGSKDYYPVKLMLGIVLFNFVNEGIIFGMNGLLDKAGIILKVNFKRHIAVIASTLMAVINLVINMVLFTIIFVIYVCTGLARDRGISGIDSLALEVNKFVGNFGHVGLCILYFVILVSVIYMFILGASFFLSILIVRLRDLQHIFELVFTLLFWATPIVYQLKDIITTPFGKFVALNPLGFVINSAREALIYNNISNLNVSLIMLVISVVLLVLGYNFFLKKVKRVAEYF